MSIQQISQCLSNSYNIQANLHDLGTILRDSEARSLDYVRSLMPTVLGFVNDYPMEVLRVLVNYTADNDENRAYMLCSAPEVCQFWESNACSSPFQNCISQVQSRLMILVTQFVRVSEAKQAELLKGLEQKKVVDWVWKFYKACVSVDVDSIDGPTEVLAAYTKEYSSSLMDDQIELIIQGLELVLEMASDEDIEDIALSHTHILVSATSLNDSQLNIPMERLLKCIAKVPKDYKNATSLKRNLFAACGGVISFSSFDNLSIVDSNLTTILEGNDGYAIAAAAISLGNCVHNKASQEQILQRIETIIPVSSVAHSILEFPYSDVVQLQAFHFFNNCMTESLAVDILLTKNEKSLFKNTKIIVDNYKYYKEVGAIYLKFLSKLIKLGYLQDHHRNVTELSLVWEYLGNLEDFCEVQVLILQAFCIQEKLCDNLSPSLCSLLSTMLLIKTQNLDAAELLVKLKTLAIFLQKVDPTAFEKSFPTAEFESSFLSKLDSFFARLDLIQQTRPSDPSSQLAYATIANNTQFVAAAAMKFYATYEGAYPSHIGNIRGKCTNILRQPHIPV